MDVSILVVRVLGCQLTGLFGVPGAPDAPLKTTAFFFCVKYIYIYHSSDFKVKQLDLIVWMC